MKKLLPYVLAFHAALAAAILLWALQEKFPGPLTNTLSPVWNSPWEMGKTAFFPLLAAAPTLWVLQKGGSRGGLCLMALSGAGCVFFEWAYRRIMKKDNTTGDLSAVVTGILVAFVCPCR